MSQPFKYKHAHWWHWFSAKKRRHLRVLNAVVKVWWEKDGERDFEKAFRESLVYGTGYMPIMWNPPNDNNEVL